MPGESSFHSLFRGRVTGAVRRSRATMLGRFIAWGGCGVVVAAAALRVTGSDDVVSFVAWGWATVVVLAVGAAGVLPRERPKTRRDVARSLDEERGAAGAVLSASWLLEGRTESRLSALVVRDADRVCTPDERRGSAPVPTTWLTLALGLICLSLLLPTVPSPFGGPGRAVGARSVGDAAAIGGAAAPNGGGAEDGAKAAAPAPDLADLARFEIRTDHQIYVLGEEIRLTGLLRPLAHVGEDVELSVVVGLADGLPSTDVGFGIGVRPVRPEWDWVLSEGSDETLRGRLDLRAHLERFGIYKVGLITIDAWVLPDEDARLSGGVQSNRLTIQIAPNRKRQKVRKPEPVEKKRQPKKRNDPRKDKEDRGNRGGKPPELGEKDRLKHAERKAKAVKPLLADGPTVDKEVEVFERQEGGDAPRPRAPKPEPESPSRTFIKSEEQAVKRLRLTPRDRRILKDYFDAIRRRQ